MGLAYHSHGDASMRLNGTICLYDKVPYYISCPERGDNETVDLYQLHANFGDKVFKHVKYTDEKFSYKPFELGYLQSGNWAAYMVRNPYRRQKQGLDRNVISFIDRLPDSTKVWFTSDSMRHCILGEYPSFDLALKAVKSKEKDGVAFHRYCAIERSSPYNLSLKYRTKEVGYMNGDKDSFTLWSSPATSFLTQILPEYGARLG